MEIGWHLNHSRTPNAKHRGYRYYALRDIKQGKEITIDYDTLGESEEEKEDYYKTPPEPDTSQTPLNQA